MTMDNGYVVGTVIEQPTVVTTNGERAVRTVLDCGMGRRLTVEGPVAEASSESGHVIVGSGAMLLRFAIGQQVAAIGHLCFAPVRLEVAKVMGRQNARQVVSLPFGPFLFVGYRRSPRGNNPEADIALLTGERLRVMLPENVFAAPGSYLTASLAWSRRHGWRSPYRLINIAAWRPPKVNNAEAA
jgi:hypothetical protein